MIAPHQLPAVTVVISTHNRRGELETTLSALRQLGYPRLQITVVDNASDDGTASLLRNDFPRVTLIPHSDNRPMRGYNMGFDSVLTPYVLVLDDDSCPQRGAIERMVEILEDHPKIGAVAANIVGPDGHSEWGAEGDADFSEDFFNLIGCGFLVRRDVLLQTAGYDESFGLYYNDLELALRILAFGHRIAYDKKAIVEHRKCSSSPTPLKLRFMMRNFPLLVRSHFSGLRRIDLILGHAAIALCHAIRNGQGGAALRGLKASFHAASQRPFLPEPDSLAVRRFVHRYSLWRHLLRKRSPPPPPASSSPPPALPLQQVPPSPNTDAPETGDDSVLSWYTSPWPDYQWHLKNVAYLPPADRLARARQTDDWSYRPLISILTPVYKTNPAHLAECLLSVERQIYPRWELCIVDDGSGLPELNRLIEDFSCRHPGQVRFVSRLDNRGIATTSQEALELASGEFIALLDHDDRLAPEALWEVVARLQLLPDADWIYSDNDKISPDGGRWYYHFKPDWSPELFDCTNYALHFSAVRRELALALGGFRKEFEGSQDYDLYLRVSEKARRIEHVSRILYSWRESPSSVARDLSNKPYAFEAGRRALAAALARRRESGAVEDSPSAWIGNFRIRRPLPADSLAVLLLGHDASPSDSSASPWIQQAGEVAITRVLLPESGETQGQALARAIRTLETPFLLVVDTRSAPESSSTLADMLRAVAAPGVAAFSPKIVSPDQTVDHCGLSFAPGGRIVFPLRGLPSTDAAYGAYGALPRNVAALSPVATLLHLARLREIVAPDPAMDPGGLLAAACLDARAKGLRVVADGGIRAIFHAPPFTPGPAFEPGGRDHVQLVQRHPTLFVAGDPFYNRNLHTSPPDFGVWHEALHT